MVHALKTEPQELPHAPPIRQPLLHASGGRGCIELLRVKRPADPRQHVRVFLVLGIADGFQEIRIAPDPTAIFRWTGTCTFQAHRVVGFRIMGRAALEQHLVSPAVAEVILVLKGQALAGLGQDFAEQGPVAGE
jgi:hypothetical protein